MKVLFTGGSSFTGYWFIRELAKSGHDIYATFTASGVDAYDGVRAERVQSLMDYCTPIWNCVFGDDRFLSLVKEEPHWDLFCHHAAAVTNYKSDEFDFGAALSANTLNIKTILEELALRGCKRVVLTGSVFEPNEGAGNLPMRAFSPYGLSKGLTAEVFKYWCQVLGLRMGKFVIPNPFGPYEEPRFTSYLANTWLKGMKAGVSTPLYVRDNIHISLLALSYQYFVLGLQSEAGFEKLNPCGYVESQGAFAQRFANEMCHRFELPCELELATQLVFDEPKVRINQDLIDVEDTAWNETTAWDELAEYYLAKVQK